MNTDGGISGRIASLRRGAAPSVLAVVVSFHNRDWLADCIGSLVASRYRSLSIIFIDNASKDGSAVFVRHTFPHIEVIELSTNIGFAGANNLAMKAAVMYGFRYLLLVNPDTRTPKGLVDELVSFMERHPDYGAIGPLQLRYLDAHYRDPFGRLNEWSLRALREGLMPYYERWLARPRSPIVPSN
jgi:GT2 family glycosyltransferase